MPANNQVAETSVKYLAEAAGQAVPVGYKQTEVGGIPEDWDCCEIGDFNPFVTSGSRGWASFYATYGDVFVRVTNMSRESIYLDITETKFVLLPYQSSEGKRTSLENGDILVSITADILDAFSHGKHILKTSCVSAGYFYPYESKSILPRDIFRSKVTPRFASIIISRMNTPDLVGELGYVEETCPDSYLPDRLWQMVFHRQAEVNTRWLAFILSFSFIAKKIKEAATVTNNSMKNISKETLLSIEIPKPSMNEQTTIATILSDMDCEIQTLQNRLSKTRQIKQGMMQELLTGKIRLVKPVPKESANV